MIGAQPILVGQKRQPLNAGWQSGIYHTELEIDEVNRRVGTNLDRAQKFESAEDRLAAQYLFSHLAHLEDIAVYSAWRGNCVKDQLVDEYVHRETFGLLAEEYGGIVEPSWEIQRIMKYLMSLDGQESLAALNVIAESWLESVFECLAAGGFCTEMIDIIEAEEERHCNDALADARPNPEVFTPIVRDLEEMLVTISGSPEFMIPLYHFMGQKKLGDMGLLMCKRHERGCQALGVEADMYPLKVSSKVARLMAKYEPDEIEPLDWEMVKLQNWTDFAPQYCYVTAEVPTTNPLKLQAMVMESVARVMDRHPQLRNVTRNGKLYRTRQSAVGLRSLYDDRRVMTLFVAEPHRKGWKKTLRFLNKAKKRLQDKPYEPYEGGVRLCPELKPIFPPHRCPVVVTYNGHTGGHYGVGPLSDMEGIPCSITIGQVRKMPRYHATGFTEDRGRDHTVVPMATFCFQMDHRTGDGQDVGTMASETTKELMRL